MNKPKGLKIALCGRMRSGKDTVGAYLVHNHDFKRYAFGDGIVQVTKELFPSAYENGIKPRALLQEFGQICVNKFDKSVWVNHMFHRMEQDGITEDDNIVITDLRQPHEYSALVERGFTIVRVNISEETQIERLQQLGEPINLIRHETEAHYDSYEVDYEVYNDNLHDSLFDTEYQIYRILENMTGGVCR